MALRLCSARAGLLGGRSLVLGATQSAFRSLPACGSIRMVHGAESGKESRLTYALHDLSALETSAPTGWTPPLSPLQKLPFEVFRTKSGLLPVYRRYKNGCTKLVTVVRKFRGDQHALSRELALLLGPDVEVKQYIGRIEVKGDHVRAVTTWLRQLGY